MKSYTITFSVDALEELREIALYIQSYNPEKAEPFVNDIIDHFPLCWKLSPKLEMSILSLSESSLMKNTLLFTL